MGGKHSNIDSKTRVGLERIRMSELSLAAKARKGNTGSPADVLEMVSGKDAAESQRLLKSLLDEPSPPSNKTRNAYFFSGRKNTEESQKFLNGLLEGAFGQDTVASEVEKPLTPHVDDAVPSKKTEKDAQKETPKLDSYKTPEPAKLAGAEIVKIRVPIRIEVQEEPSGEKILADYASLLHAKEKWRNLSWLSGYNSSMGAFKKLIRRVMKVSGDNAILARETEIRTKFVENAALAIAAGGLQTAAVLHAYNEVAECLRKGDGERAKKEHYERIDLERRASAIKMAPDAMQIAREIDADMVSYVVNNARDRIRTKEDWLSVPEIGPGETAKAQQSAMQNIVFTDADSAKAKKSEHDSFQPVNTVEFVDMQVEKKEDERPAAKRSTKAEPDGPKKDAVYMPLEAAGGKKHSALLEKAVAAFAPEASDGEKIELKGQLKEYLMGKHAADYVVPASKVPKSEKTDSSEGNYLRFTGENWREFVSWAVLNGKSLPSALRKPANRTISWKKTDDGKRTTTS